MKLVTGQSRKEKDFLEKLKLKNLNKERLPKGPQGYDDVG